MRSNPNWPVLDYAICWASGRAASPVQDNWCSVAERTEGKVRATRGKTYELDQVQPGELSLTLRNDDGVFDPSNTASPYAGYVLPYRLLRVRAQWPPTPNLLTADQATAFYATGGAGAAGGPLPAHTSPVTGTTTSIVNVGATNAYQVDLSVGDQYKGVEIAGFSAAPGVTYTVQCQVLAFGVTAGLSVKAAVIWNDASGAYLAGDVGTTSVPPTGTAGTWTVTSTAPAGAAGGLIVVENTGVATGTASIQFSQFQIEKAAAASTYTTPGTWYPLFTGYIERWPQSWTSGGNYGLVTLTVVDAFAWLSSYGLDHPGYLDVLQLGPTWFYPLDEGSGATRFADATGNRAPATIWTPPQTPQDTITAGGSYSADRGQVPAGIPGPVLQKVQATGSVAAQMLDFTGGGANRAGPGTTAWTRMMAVQFHKDTLLANGGDQWMWIQGPNNSKASIAWWVQAQSDGSIGGVDGGGVQYDTVQVFDTAGNEVYLGECPYDLTGGWFLFMIGWDPAVGFKMWVDGYAQTVGAGTGTFPTAADLAGGVDVIGGIRVSGTNVNAPSVAFDLAYCAEFPFLLSDTQVASLYLSWASAWSTQPAAIGGITETSDTRYQRILDWIGYAGPTRIGTGDLRSYGPASDIVGGQSPTAALTGLQNVVTSELGGHYVAADGTLVFDGRSARWNTSPVATFGEHAGEIGYDSAAIDFDPTRLANDVTTQVENANYGTSSMAREIDQASKDNYGTVTLQETINTVDGDDLIGAAQYLLYQNSEPSPRLEALPVDVAANPTHWPDLLARELSDCVQVYRRPSNAPAFSILGHIEQITWELDDAGNAKWTGQVTPAAGHQFCALDDASYGLLDTARLAY